MKRAVFVIDDKINDVSGILLSLNAMLLNQLSDEEQVDTSIFVLHIIWDSDENIQSLHEFFDRELRDVQSNVRRVGRSPLEHVQYIPISLKNEAYSIDSCSILVEQIVDEQKKLIEERWGENLLNGFPEVNGTTLSYAVFLDIVLSLQKDRGYIEGKKEVLSSCLYNRYPHSHCIVYTNYHESGITESWMDIAATNEAPIHREFLSRARAIHIDIRNKLYHALSIK